MKYIVMLLFAMVSASAFAQSLVSVNCQDLLFNEAFTPQTTFTEPSDVCFYGPGFDGSVTAKLSNEAQMFTVNVQATNGILTSVSGKFFDEIPVGTYTLSAGEIEYFVLITVLGEDNGGGDGGQEIPEFSAGFAALILAGAAAFIHAKRKVHR